MVLGKVARFLIIILSLVVSLSSFPAMAWENDPVEGGEVNERWQVARLRVTEGSVLVLPDGGEEWDEGEGNLSISEGDRIRVPKDGAASLSFRGQEILLSEGADIAVVYLRDERSAFRLNEGKARLRLSEYDFIPMRVSLPNGGRVRVSVPAGVRISVGEDDESMVRVSSGEAVVSDPEGGKVRVLAGQQAFVDDGVRVSQYSEPSPEEPPPPPLSDEERRVEAPPAAVSELRNYGDWVYAGDYGYAWSPRVSVGWSPFLYGSWGWSVSLGWNWVSYEPWGWFPYHCGRWYQDSRRGWLWVPQGAFASVSSPYRPRVNYYRPVGYHPATVRFERNGSNVRWVPLAPRERYVRPVIRRDEAQIYRYSRPLPTGTVFAREWGKGGGRNADGWRGVEQRAGRRTDHLPGDGRPVWRIGDEKAPYRGDRVVAPRRAPSSRGETGRPVRPGREEGVRKIRDAREPRAVSPAGRAVQKERAAAPPPARAPQGVRPAAPPPARVPQNVRPATPPPARAPQNVRPAAPPPARAPQNVRPAAPSPARAPQVERQAAPPAREDRGGRDEGRPAGGGGRSR